MEKESPILHLPPPPRPDSGCVCDGLRVRPGLFGLPVSMLALSPTAWPSSGCIVYMLSRTKKQIKLP